MGVPFPTGVVPSLQTPFTAGGDRIDTARAARHAEWYLERGVHGVLVAGSGGEFISLSLDERRALTEAVTEAIGDRVAVIVCIGAYTTNATIALGQHARSCGASALLTPMPYYMKPPPSVARRYLTDVREAVDLPLMLYNVPATAGVEPSRDDLLQLIDEEILQGVKQSFPDPYHVRELKDDVGDRAAIFAGHDACAFEAMIDGADGWISVFPTVFPERARKIWDDIKAGVELPVLSAQWRKALPFVRFVYDEELKTDGEPHWLEACKTAVNLVGSDVGPPRAPFRLLEGRDLERLEALVAQLLESETA
jgi:4-hydroxy-tetrahydrodipicolinate synthase